jgi:Mg-chelatase subunit ChlD
LAGAAGISADVRTEPIDVIVALDKSLSMVEEIGAVVEYVNTYIIDQLLIPGDYFLVLAFYGRTEIPVAMRITGDADKQKAKQAVAALAANGRFTDIGNALDVLGAELAKLPEQNRRKHLLLITDGIQEAPPASRYYSRDGKFTHEFLQSTKTIQKQGWKIEILGIGTHAGAGELAENRPPATRSFPKLRPPRSSSRRPGASCPAWRSRKARSSCRSTPWAGAGFTWD